MFGSMSGVRPMCEEMFKWTMATTATCKEDSMALI
jgi:hypothetical protein